jgi:hypothetical protein
MVPDTPSTVQAHVPSPWTIVVPSEWKTIVSVSVAGPVNVPARAAVRLAVTKVLPPSVRVLVMVTVREVKVPLAGEPVLAEAGTAGKAAAAAAATMLIRIVVLRFMGDLLGVMARGQ